MARTAQRRDLDLGVIPRGRRRAGVPFGRSEMGVPSGQLTDMGCPDCRGVLAVREEGPNGHLAFTCRVGHAFSAESLIRVKEDQLEDTLWAAVEVFEEVAMLHRELAARARANRARTVAALYLRRSKQAEGQMRRLRAIIASDVPAAAERRKG